MSSGGPADGDGGYTYLLIHPERVPSNDLDAALSPEAQFADGDTFRDLDRAYGRAVAKRIARAWRALCLLDPAEVELLVLEAIDDGEEIEDLDDLRNSSASILDGVKARDLDLLEGDTFAVEEAVVAALSDEPAGSIIYVGGFARSDCVRRAIEALRGAGLDARECPVTTMPLRRSALAWIDL